MPLVPALTLAFIVSVCNGFFWNRRWTFKEARQNAAHDQYWRFMLVNIVGWLLNTSIVVLIVAHFAAHETGGAFGDWETFKQIATAILTGAGKARYSWQIVDGSQFAASMVVVFWNFFANRLWTFKH
jgi:putative flippase GtrA